MSRADAERWDARYDGQRPATPRRPDAVTDEIADRLPTSGRALDVACGAGAQALWSAQRGLSVVAIDVSPTAVSMTVAAAKHAGLDESIDARVVDLDAGLPASLTDFDMIICQRFRDPQLYPSFVDRLVVGGVAVITVLSEVGADSPGPFHAPADELAIAFDRPDCERLEHASADGQESIVFRRTT